MTTKPGSTIYDVAAKAGVSISTVSRYMNAPEKVNAATAERIKAVIRDMAYFRHGNAGTRRSRHAARIGVMAPFFPAPSFVERMEGMTPVFHEAMCEMLVYSIDSLRQLDQYLHSGFLTKRLDGLIVMAMVLSDDSANTLQRSGLQTVLIEQHNPLFCSIECDNVAGGRLAADYLTGKGYSPCGYIGQAVHLPYSLQPSELRVQGYKSGLAAADQPLKAEFVRLGEVSVAGGFALTTSLLAAPVRPRAIFAMSDLQAIGALKAARALGLRVPEDVAVIGFDDIEAADYVELTTISQELKESGRLAAELVLGRIKEPDRPLNNLQLRVSVVERASA